MKMNKKLFAAAMAKIFSDTAAFACYVRRFIQIAIAFLLAAAAVAVWFEAEELTLVVLTGVGVGAGIHLLALIMEPLCERISQEAYVYYLKARRA